MLGAVLSLILEIYFFILIARIVMDMVLAFNRGYRPTGATAVAFEIVYSSTEPLLKPLRRIIPPLRIGNFALDLSFLVLFFAVQYAAFLVTKI